MAALWSDGLPDSRRVVQADWRSARRAQRLCSGAGERPYRSIVVASSDDPYCPIRRAGAYARAWGSEFVRLQTAGHINVESGHGDWPLGFALLQSLTGEQQLFAGVPDPHTVAAQAQDLAG